MFLLYLGLGQGQVQENADKRSKCDAGKREGQVLAHCKGKGSPTDADDQNHAADGQVALVLIIHSCINQRSESAGSNGAEEQHRDASEHWIRNGLNKCSEFGEE